jgi:hypothetical protein
MKHRKPQISPLRYAPVEMTNLLNGLKSGLQQICHLDRSVAQWRDLRFRLVFTQIPKPAFFSSSCGTTKSRALIPGSGVKTTILEVERPEFVDAT